MGRFPLEGVPDATLLVGTNSTQCNNCGMNAIPSQQTHDRVYGYYADEERRPDGCGIEFTHIISTYFGEEMRQATRELRPDLTFLDIEEMWKVPKPNAD